MRMFGMVGSRSAAEHLSIRTRKDLTNVIKIRRGKETHVFRTDTLSDKRNVLSLLRQVSEELAIKKRKEREGEHERRRSVWTDDVRRTPLVPRGHYRGATALTSPLLCKRNSFMLGGGAEPMPALPSWLADLQSKGVGGDKKEEKDIRWVGDFVDKLAVSIALREWEEAVGSIEQGEGLRDHSSVSKHRLILWNLQTKPNHSPSDNGRTRCYTPPTSSRTAQNIPHLRPHQGHLRPHQQEADHRQTRVVPQPPRRRGCRPRRVLGHADGCAEEARQDDTVRRKHQSLRERVGVGDVHARQAYRGVVSGELERA